MRTTKASSAFIALLLTVSSVATWAAPGYRLIPLDDGHASTTAFDLNRRGEVVGMRAAPGGATHAFLWRAGSFTDLNDRIDPASNYTQAGGMNDRSSIVGFDWTGEAFHGYLLRGTRVSPIALGVGETQVFPFDLNNHGQMLGDAVVGGVEKSLLVDGGQVQELEGLPGETDPMHAVALNESGDVAGNTRTAAGTRALLWQDGAVMNLGVAPGTDSSFAYALNCRGDVVGIADIKGASHAMRWRDGGMRLLPRLPGEIASEVLSINNSGVMVGGTSMSQGGSMATMWWSNHVVKLDSLVDATDPLKPFVHLQEGEKINDGGDIVASGVDSRTGARIIYFMTRR